VSIKDEIQHVKAELSGDEKLLENAFRLERIYKKYKGIIWGAVILLVVGWGGKAAWDTYTRNRLETANSAFLQLQKNPDDAKAQATLQEYNPKLYALYRLSRALKSAQSDALKTLGNDADPLIADIARYHAAVENNATAESTYYHDLSIVEMAYLDLKEGNKAQARSRLSLIPETSPLSKIAQLLKHYTLTAH
jgi:hypothetical protein